jgi:16S rRNA (guanine1207-N2)-methyltransferase
MSDPATSWLINQITASRSTSLWFSDENILQAIPLISQQAHMPLLICNRWDIAQQAQERGLSAQFSDFDCRDIADNSQDQVFYRISKEKPIVHHIINQAFRVLKPNGELIICGQKNEGIKTYIEKARALFHSDKPMRKDGANYFAMVNKKRSCASITTNELLDDSEYPHLRRIDELHQRPLYSKPGLFGWNKIDQGSALLIDQLDRILPSLKSMPESLLDLGCGYGYLTLMTSNLFTTKLSITNPSIKQRTLTDNNAAALIAARQNCLEHKLEADIVAGDAGSTLSGSYDLILCNPPFHQGFSIDGNLTDKFLAASKRLLAKDGIAVFVVNQFIPLERQAQTLFAKINLVTQTSGFKIVSLQHR